MDMFFYFVGTRQG